MENFNIGDKVRVRNDFATRPGIGGSLGVIASKFKYDEYEYDWYVRLENDDELPFRNEELDLVEASQQAAAPAAGEGDNPHWPHEDALDELKFDIDCAWVAAMPQDQWLSELPHGKKAEELATAIINLQDENATLREALQPFADTYERFIFRAKDEDYLQFLQAACDAQLLADSGERAFKALAASEPASGDGGGE